MIRHYFQYLLRTLLDELSLSKSTKLDINIPISILSWKYKIEVGEPYHNWSKQNFGCSTRNLGEYNCRMLGIKKGFKLVLGNKICQTYILKVIIVIVNEKSYHRRHQDRNLGVPLFEILSLFQSGKQVGLQLTKPIIDV